MPVSSQALVLFTRQLAIMYNAGIPLPRAILALSHQCEDPALAFVLLGLLWAVRKGRSLSDAMAAYPAAFPRLYRALVEEGESGGQLFPCLERAAQHLEDSGRLRRRVRSAAAYPLLVLGVGTATGVLCLKLMIPFLLELFAGASESLPWTTRLLLLLVRVLQNGWFLGGSALFLASLVLAARARLKTSEGRLWKDRWLLRLPLAGRLFLQFSLCRVARTLSTSVRSGLKFPQTLQLCSEVSGCEVLRRDLLKARRALLKGIPLERYFQSRRALYTPAFSAMVAVGQESGNLDRVADRLADLLEMEAEARLEALLALLQPGLMVLMGGFVGFVSMAALTPIYQGLQGL